MSDVRVRRHADGRVALTWPETAGYWTVVDGSDLNGLGSDDTTSGPGWCELLVTELPEPDHNGEGVDDEGNDTAPDQWEVNCLREVDGVITAWTNGIEIEGMFYDADEGTIEELEIDALKLLAAIAAHRSVS